MDSDGRILGIYLCTESVVNPTPHVTKLISFSVREIVLR